VALRTRRTRVEAGFHWPKVDAPESAKSGTNLGPGGQALMFRPITPPVEDLLPVSCAVSVHWARLGALRGQRAPLR